MRIFVTGASGFIGSAITQELLRNGHQVLALARSDKSAQALLAAGAEVHRGDLEDLESLRQGALAADGVIHAGFNHDFSKFAENCQKDGQAIEALGEALAGSERPLIVTSGTALLASTHLATEDDMPPTMSHNPRKASEDAATRAAVHGVNVTVVRLPPTVHGEGDHAFVPLLIALARDKGISAYVGDGLNRWPAVHRLDAALLFRLAIEQASAAKTNLHGVAEEGIAFKDIAAVIGKHLNIPVVSQSSQDAAEHFGWFAPFAAMNNPTSSQETQNNFGWNPTQAGLIADLDQESYFRVT
jgi:nucleoside-diphosphate-sugar epimerase